MEDYQRRIVDPLHCPLLDNNLILFMNEVEPFRLYDDIDTLYDHYVNAVNLMICIYDVQLS